MSTSEPFEQRRPTTPPRGGQGDASSPEHSEPRYGQRIPDAGHSSSAYGQQARPAPTSFTNGRGGLTDTARSMWRQAPVTVGIIVAAVVVFGLQQVMPGLTRMLGFSPVVALTEPWRFLTTAFLHGSLMHLAFNMWALWAIGSSLEPYLGRARYALLFILSAIGGSTAIYMLASPMSRDWLTLTVGASGAVFGMFAAVFVIQRRMGRDTTSIVMLLLVNAAISLFGAGISWQGHLGGFLTGLVISSIYAWAPWDLKTKGIVASAGVALALAAMIAFKVFLVF